MTPSFRLIIILLYKVIPRWNIKVVLNELLYVSSQVPIMDSYKTGACFSILTLLIRPYAPSVRPSSVCLSTYYCTTRLPTGT